MMPLYNSIQAILADHPAPANVTHVSQDQDGKVYGYLATPRRPNGHVEWYGVGKVLIADVGPENVIHSWHNYYLNMANYAKEAERNAKKAEAASERDFGELPGDYGIAVAYAKKVKNCQDRNIKFGLTFEQYRELFLTDVCCVSGNKLSHNGSPMGMNQHSIDRLDSNKGYVPGNCVVMAATLNSVKADVDKMLANVQASDEHKLKLLYKAENVLRKRIKAKKAEEEARLKEASARAESFESRFAIFPK